MTEPQNKSETSLKEETIDLKAIIKKFAGYWYYFLVSIGICLFIGFLYNRYTRPIYSVSATIEIRDDSNSQLGTENILEGMELFSVKTNLENEKAILKSYALAEKTIRELNLGVSYFQHGSIQKVNLYKKSPFIVVFDSTHLQLTGVEFFINILNKEEFVIEFNCSDQNTYDILNNKKNNKVKANYDYEKTHTFGEKIETNHFSFRIIKSNIFEKINKHPSNNPEDITKYCSEIHSGKTHAQWKELEKVKLLEKFKKTNYSMILHTVEKLSKKYVNALNVSAINSESSILKLNITGTTSMKNKDYLNKISELYLLQGLKEKNKMATNTIMFIESQIAKTQDTLDLIENKLEQFKVKNPNLDVFEKDFGTFFQKQKTEGNISQYQIYLGYYEELLSYLEESNDSEKIISPTSMGISNPELNTLISEFIILNSKKKELELSTKESHPKYQSVLSQIIYTKQSIIENLKNLISSTKSALQNEQNRVSQFEQDIKLLPEAEKQYVKLKRKFMQSERIVDYLILKKQETSIAKEGTEADHIIIDRAREDTPGVPISPKKKLSYFLALLIGFGIPISIISLRDFFNETIRSKSDVLKITKIPILGVIGHSEKTDNLIVKNSPKSIITESFRSLRTNIQYLSSEKSKVITITSSVGSEGKTFCASNIGLILSSAGYKTIIIGADLRKPATHKDFNKDNSIGLSTYLINKCSEKDIIYKSKYNNLSIINSGPTPPNPSELLNNDRMKKLIQKLKNKFEYIIIDTPPIGIVTDGVITMKLSDINLYIIRDNYTKRNMLNMINNLDSTKQISNTNIIINDYQFNSSGYGYGYGYGYIYEGSGDGYYEQ